MREVKGRSKSGNWTDRRSSHKGKEDLAQRKGEHRLHTERVKNKTKVQHVREGPGYDTRWETWQKVNLKQDERWVTQYNRTLTLFRLSYFKISITLIVVWICCIGGTKGQALTSILFHPGPKGYLLASGWDDKRHDKTLLFHALGITGGLVFDLW